MHSRLLLLSCALLVPILGWTQPTQQATSLVEDAQAVMASLDKVGTRAVSSEQDARQRSTEHIQALEKARKIQGKLEQLLTQQEMQREESDLVATTLENLKKRIDAAEARHRQFGADLVSLQLKSIARDRSSRKYEIDFDVNSSYISGASQRNKLRDLAARMKYDLKMKIEIRAYAESKGDAKYNKWLSGRRAERIRELFIESYLVDADRILLKPVEFVKESGPVGRRVVVTEVY